MLALSTQKYEQFLHTSELTMPKCVLYIGSESRNNLISKTQAKFCYPQFKLGKKTGESSGSLSASFLENVCRLQNENIFKINNILKIYHQNIIRLKQILNY